ncbi:MAG: hypothetical protein JWO36_2661 [Myxococcales bacterium]|nr:hypothetical protein [Myxococcales bacterium]
MHVRSASIADLVTEARTIDAREAREAVRVKGVKRVKRNSGPDPSPGSGSLPVKGVKRVKRNSGPDPSRIPPRCT